ncbi:MAG: hypothetical protein ACM31C_05160 [Acidobacteriota bacterium]
MSHPWYVRALLVNPDRVIANAARMHAAGVVDAMPDPWQLSLGVLRLWHRVVFRSETVGTSALPVRDGWRARLLHHRALRLPFLLASRAVIPLDFTGLRSSPDRLIDHLLGAHHDGNQFVFDLELLAGHGVLDELARRVAAIVDGTDPRARWLRDLAVFAGYHEALAGAVARARAAGPAMSSAEASDPDLTLRGLFAWCSAQPRTPAATLAAWRAGRFRVDAPARPPAPIRDALLTATPAELAAALASGHPVAPEQLAGAEYHGTSLGLPRWLERATWKTFIKAFVTDGDRVRGWNIRVDQRAPWTPRTRRGRTWTFGHFTAEREAGTTVLDYGRASSRLDPIHLLRDPLVALVPGSADRLLGVSLIDVAGVRLPTPAYFLLERGGPVRDHVSAR